MKKIISLLLLAMSVSLWAESEGPGQVQANTDGNDGLNKNVLESEKVIDKNIQAVNNTFKSHSKLMLMKVRVLPKNVMIYKGTADGDSCKKAEKQEDGQNNCLYLESYSYVSEETGKPTGIQSKSLVLFFEGNASGNDPRAEAPRNISKIKTKVYKKDFSKLDYKYLIITDEAPLSEGGHNEQVKMFMQNDGFPPRGTKETKENRGVGVYTIAAIENSNINPIRNRFKRDAYVKNLHFFERLMSKIYFTNDKKATNYTKVPTNF